MIRIILLIFICISLSIKLFSQNNDTILFLYELEKEEFIHTI